VEPNEFRKLVPRLRLLLYVIIGLVVVMFLLTLVPGGPPGWLFPFGLALLIVVVVGSSVIISLALRIRREERQQQRTSR